MRLSILGFAASVLIGCAAPYHVVQLDSLGTPAKGVRYTLKRPVFSAGLQLAGPKRVKPNEKCKFQLVLAQKLEGRRFYEIRRPPGWKLPFYAFSDTTVSIALDDEGNLSSVIAKETDQSLEVVKAVVDLAKTAAAAATAARVAADDSTQDCGDTLPDETRKGWNAYLETKARLEEELDHLREARSAQLVALSGLDPVQQEKALISLNALDARIAVATLAIKSHKLPLHESNYRLVLPGETDDGKASFLTIKLEEMTNDLN